MDVLGVDLVKDDVEAGGGDVLVVVGADGGVALGE